MNGAGGSGTAIPGLVDLQVNGFGGVDFAAADDAAYRRAGEALLECGVTAFQPTLITAPEAELVAALAEVARADRPTDRRRPPGGPVPLSLRLGAHPVTARRDPDAGLLERLLAAGHVSEMTLAPELDGALELIDVLNAHGVVVSCGHSDATAEQANRAFDRGAATVTHLFNAMRPLGHRDPGIAGAALARDDVVVQLILDGHHLAEETARVVWRAAAGRIALVSDAVAAAGIGDGSFRLGSVEVEVRDGVVRRDDGVLAGSSSTLVTPSGICTRSARPCPTRSPPPRRCRHGSHGAPTWARWRRARQRTSSSSTTHSRSGPCSSAARRSWSLPDGRDLLERRRRPRRRRASSGWRGSGSRNCLTAGRRRSTAIRSTSSSPPSSARRR